jgi:Zinc finger, C3HC4 type (RING finger)
MEASYSSTEDEDSPVFIHAQYGHTITELRNENASLRNSAAALRRRMVRYLERIRSIVAQVASYRSQLGTVENQRDMCVGLLQQQEQHIHEREQQIVEQNNTIQILQTVLHDMRERERHLTRPINEIIIIDESDDTNQQEECILCLEHPRTIAFVPCGHYLACETCSNIVVQGHRPNCPICNAEIAFALRVFRS